MIHWRHRCSGKCPMRMWRTGLRTRITHGLDNKQIDAPQACRVDSTMGTYFTPAQYANAVRAGSTQAQRATTSGINNQFATQAQQVLGSKVPDSGTVGRGLEIGGLAALASHPELLFEHPVASAALGALIPAYGTNAGRQAMLTLLARRLNLMQKMGGGIVWGAPLVRSSWR